MLVVLLNVERYELAHRFDGIERVQKQPLVFQLPPP